MTPRSRTWPEAAWWVGAAAAYLVLALLLAPQLIFGPLRDANDFPNAFTYAEWIRRSFPAMPFWFPYQGAGISPSSAYAVAPAYAVAGLAWAGIDLVLAARVLAFLTFPFGALGVAACGEPWACNGVRASPPARSRSYPLRPGTSRCTAGSMRMRSLPRSCPGPWRLWSRTRAYRREGISLGCFGLRVRGDEHRIGFYRSPGRRGRGPWRSRR